MVTKKLTFIVFGVLVILSFVLTSAGAETLEERLAINEQSIKQYPNSRADLRVEKAEILIGLKRYVEALYASDGASYLDPDFADAYSVKSRALYGLQRYDHALNAINKALELRPGHESDMLVRETILKAMGK